MKYPISSDTKYFEKQIRIGLCPICKSSLYEKKKTLICAGCGYTTSIPPRPLDNRRVINEKTIKEWAVIHPDTSELQYDLSLRERPRRDTKKCAWVFNSKRVA